MTVRQETDPEQAAETGWRLPAVFHSLRVKQYRRYMVSFLGSGMGFHGNQVALGWLAFDLTGDTRALGFALFLNGIAMVAGSMFGGVIADRFDRRTTIVGLQILQMAMALVMALLVVFDALELWHLYLVSLFTGLVMSLSMPSRQAFVYNIVGRRYLANAMALNMGTMNGMRLIGPAIAGVLIGSIGVEAVYFLSGAGFLLSIGVISFYVGPTTQVFEPAREAPLRAMGEGFKYLWRCPHLFWMFILALGGALLGIPFRDLIPAFAVDALGQGPEGYGLLLSMVGLGALLGSVTVASMANSRYRSWLVIGGGLGIGVFTVALAFVGSLSLALVLFLVLGWVTTVFTTTMNIIIQMDVDDAFRGRMASIYMLTFAIHPVGALGLGAVARETGIADAYMFAGLAMIGYLFFMLLWRKELRSKF